jgi:hypothetical protein
MNHNINISEVSHGKGPIFQLDIQFSRNVKEAYQLDMKNGNKNWENAMNDEINSLLVFNTFEDKGKIPFLDGCKSIIVHFVFAGNRSTPQGTPCYAGGHRTDPDTEGTYSCVVSLRTMRIVLVAAKLIKLNIIDGDKSSAYLEAYTQEKIVSVLVLSWTS